MHDKQKIIDYINKVCLDSCKSENRPVDVEYQFSIFREDIFVFAVKTKYERVARRISYRLYKNFKKNFPDLIMNDVSRPVRYWNYEYDGNGHLISFYENVIDENFSVAEWNLFGQWGTLAYCMDDPKINPHLENEGGLNRYLYMVEHGFEPNHDYNSDVWIKFCSEYKRIFGEELSVQPETIDVIKLEGKDSKHTIYRYGNINTGYVLDTTFKVVLPKIKERKNNHG